MSLYSNKFGGKSVANSNFVLSISADSIAHKPARVEALTPHFRTAFWGDSHRQVMGMETAKLGESTGNSLVYEAEVAGVPVRILYSFVDDKLVSATYIGKQDYYDATHYLDDYEDFKEILVKKYGFPSIDIDPVRHISRSKGDRDKLGIAIKLGRVDHLAHWETAETKISLLLWGKEYKVFFGIQYFSKEFSHLEDKQKHKEQKADLADF